MGLEFRKRSDASTNVTIEFFEDGTAATKEHDTFYGLTIKLDDGKIIKNVKAINLEAAGFYLERSTTDKTEINLARRPIQNILLREQQSAGVDAGTFTSGDWRTRDINTKVIDETGIVTLTNKQFTLPAGGYFIFATVPAFGVGAHKAKLRNITAGTNVIIGTTAMSNAVAPSQTFSAITGNFRISSPTVFEIQHQAQLTLLTNGFGAAAGFSTIEVYAEVLLRRSI